MTKVKVAWLRGTKSRLRGTKSRLSLTIGTVDKRLAHKMLGYSRLSLIPRGSTKVHSPPPRRTLNQFLEPILVETLLQKLHERYTTI